MVIARREALSRERVLRAALAVADREGIEAVSMRKVGEQLGVEAMSLYNHVANKAAMLDGLFEGVLSELPEVSSEKPWEEALRERAHALRDALRAHPRVLPLFATRPAVTPASLAHVESALAALSRAGFDDSQSLAVFNVLVAYVVGHTLATYGPAGASDEQSHPGYERLDAAQFPRVRALAKVLATHDYDAEFALGLDALVRGLAARHDKGTTSVLPGQKRKSPRSRARD